MTKQLAQMNAQQLAKQQKKQDKVDDKAFKEAAAQNQIEKDKAKLQREQSHFASFLKPRPVPTITARQAALPNPNDQIQTPATEVPGSTSPPRLSGKKHDLSTPAKPPQKKQQLSIINDTESPVKNLLSTLLNVRDEADSPPPNRPDELQLDENEMDIDKVWNFLFHEMYILLSNTG